MAIDQITLSILVNNLYWVTEEMNQYLCHAAFSTNIKVRRDCSCAIYSVNGEMVAQGEFIPVHLGVMSQTLKEILKEYPLDTFEEGDIIIHNDPYKMGSHLWDVMLFKPVFYEGKAIAFLGVLAHHVDIGGSPLYYGMHTIFEEGVRIPPIKLYSKGVLEENVMKLILNNVRTPYEARGDLAAQTAALYRGEVRLQEIAKKMGRDKLMEYLEAILAYSEKGMRDIIAETKDGVAEFEDIVEHDGIQEHEAKIHVKLEIRGDEIYVDFSGTDPANAGPINSPWALTCSGVYYAIKSVLGTNVPTNAGAYRPIHIIRGEESLVDARFPHACNMCTTIPVERIADVTIGAFSKLAPENVCACDGNWLPARFMGTDPRNNRYNAFVETYGAGRGAKYNDDGADAHQTHMTNTENAPVEVIELEHPLKVDKYQLVTDSCGAGKYRGGVALEKEITIQTEMDITASPLRTKVPPYGLYGGSAGAPDYCAIEMPDGTCPTNATDVPKGTKVIIRTSGGGGWGNPLERDFAAIEKDVLDGYVSDKAAKEIYKVVIDPATHKVDEAKTKELRAS